MADGLERLTNKVCIVTGAASALAEVVAGTVAYLASDDAGFITGAAFPLGGGIPSAFTVPP